MLVFFFSDALIDVQLGGKVDAMAKTAVGSFEVYKLH